MNARRDKLYAKWLVDDTITPVKWQKMAGIGKNTACEDVEAVRKRFDREILRQIASKAAELLNAGIDMTEPSPLTNIELLRARAYVDPPITKVKAEVEVTSYDGVLKMTKGKEEDG